MRKLLVFCLLASTALAESAGTDADFRSKLGDLLDRTEKSITLVRKQISDNQSAPFLPDLYLQLGELLSQKASALYYVQMEREGKTDGKQLARNATSPLMETEKEAIEAYKTILKDYPQFDRRLRVYYLLAVSLKAIDEMPLFLKVSGKLAGEFPDALETARVGLLLAQHLFEKGVYDQAEATLLPITRSKFDYEKNAAKHRLALVYLARDKAKEALALFEEVLLAKDLKEGDYPAEISLKTRSVKTSLKREALLDSLRAYTNVFTGKSSPVEYYSRVAPSEVLFQEAMEKLAIRYASLKRFDESIQLLRTIAERTADPQKAVNLYRDVLSLIPLKDRLQIGPEEMRAILVKYNEWISFYEIPGAARDDSAVFFERQLRDLGTRAHELAKSAPAGKPRLAYLDQARSYYLLYLGIFRKSQNLLKIAVNLADVYFAEQRYVEAADFYLRAFTGEFAGAPAAGVTKEQLAESAILSARKRTDASYYDQLRLRGLLMRAVTSYMAFSPKLRNDPRLNFLLVKAKFEQQADTEAVSLLYGYLKRFGSSKYAADAGELILDYFNTRKDFPGLIEWAGRILSLRLSDTAFVAKVTKIKQQAGMKRLDEKIQAQAIVSGKEGQTYLKTALSLDDKTLKSAALQKALARSRAEGDVDTFLASAVSLARDEKDLQKRAAILVAASKESARITRFYSAIATLRKVYADGAFPMAERAAALEQAAEIALLLRDWPQLAELVREPSWASLAPTTRARVRESIATLVDSTVEVPTALAREALTGDEALSALYRAKDTLDGSVASQVESRVATVCAQGADRPVCRWSKLAALERAQAEILSGNDRAPASGEAVQAVGSKFAQVAAQYRALENSGDVALEVALSLKSRELYEALGGYLKDASQASPALKDVLGKKANESFASAKAYLTRCREVVLGASAVTPADYACLRSRSAPLEKLTRWKKSRSPRSEGGDIGGDVMRKAQVKLFGEEPHPAELLALAESYLRNGNLQHAAAAASVGASIYRAQEGDFRAVLGCSLEKLGLWSEALFNLKKASGYQGLAGGCMKELRGMESES